MAFEEVRKTEASQETNILMPCRRLPGIVFCQQLLPATTPSQGFQGFTLMVGIRRLPQPASSITRLPTEGHITNTRYAAAEARAAASIAAVLVLLIPLLAAISHSFHVQCVAHHRLLLPTKLCCLKQKATREQHLNDLPQYALHSVALT